MRALWILALAVGAGCVVLMLQLSGGGAGATPRMPAQASHELALTPSVPVLAATPAFAAPGGPPALAATDDAGDPARTPEDLTAQRAQLRREREELRVRIHAAMEREPRDARWSAQVETELRGSVDKAVHTARLESVDCRSSLCAVVMTHPHVDAQTESMSALAGAPGFRLAGTAHLEHDRDGRITTYVFLARGRDHFPRY